MSAIPVGGAGRLFSSSTGVSAAVGQAPLACACAGVAVALLGPPACQQLPQTLCQGGGGISWPLAMVRLRRIATSGIQPKWLICHNSRSSACSSGGLGLAARWAGRRGVPGFCRPDCPGDIITAREVHRRAPRLACLEAHMWRFAAPDRTPAAWERPAEVVQAACSAPALALALAKWKCWSRRVWSATSAGDQTSVGAEVWATCRLVPRSLTAAHVAAQDAGRGVGGERGERRASTWASHQLAAPNSRMSAGASWARMT